MKALAADICYKSVDELRQACGGASFLLSSGISDIWLEQAPQPTYEGATAIMLQQSSRMLLKQAKKIKAGKEPHEFFTYMADMERLLSTPSGATTIQEFLDPDHIQRALATRAIYFTMRVHKMLTESDAPSKTK